MPVNSNTISKTAERAGYPGITILDWLHRNNSLGEGSVQFDNENRTNRKMTLRSSKARRLITTGVVICLVANLAACFDRIALPNAHASPRRITTLLSTSGSTAGIQRDSRGEAKWILGEKNSADLIAPAGFGSGPGVWEYTQTLASSCHHNLFRSSITGRAPPFTVSFS